jgi:hypothetical protein
MADDAISLLRSIILRREEIACKLAGHLIKMCLYVLYEGPNGIVWAGGMQMPLDVPVYVPVAQLQDISPTGRIFKPDPTFRLDDPRYSDALAIIDTAHPA